MHAPTDAKLQAEHLSYLGDQKVTLKNCVTMSVLSTHSEDEQFLDQPNELVTVSRGLCEDGWDDFLAPAQRAGDRESWVVQGRVGPFPAPAQRAGDGES